MSGALKKTLVWTGAAGVLGFIAIAIFFPDLLKTRKQRILEELDFWTIHFGGSTVPANFPGANSEWPEQNALREMFFQGIIGLSDFTDISRERVESQYNYIANDPEADEWRELIDAKGGGKSYLTEAVGEVAKRNQLELKF